MAQRLTSLTDPYLKVFSDYDDGELKDPHQLKGLDNALRRQGVDASALNVSQGLFIAESRKVIERAIDAGFVPFAVLVEDIWVGHDEALLQTMEQRWPSLPVYIGNSEQMRALTGYKTTRGPLAAFLRPAPPTFDAFLQGKSRIAIFEDINNYTNIGALFRAAAALGIEGILVSPSCHDPFYRRASRVSMGAVFQVPWLQLQGDRHWADAYLPSLSAQGFTSIAMALTPDAVDLGALQFNPDSPIAIILGNEADGIQPETLELCDYTAIIPMANAVDSLNVACAAAVAFWHFRKA